MGAARKAAAARGALKRRMGRILETYERMLRDPDPPTVLWAVRTLRRHASWLVTALAWYLETTTDFTRRLRAVMALEAVGPADWWGVYWEAVRLMGDDDGRTQRAGWVLLRSLGPPPTPAADGPAPADG